MKHENQIEAMFKDFLQDIYIIGQESESIETDDFIKIIENRLLSFNVLRELGKDKPILKSS
jgi:hypothetical protein